MASFLYRIAEIVEPQTPFQLAERLGVGFVPVLKALVGRSRYVRPEQQMDAQVSLDVAHDLGFAIEGNTLYGPSPPGIEAKANWRKFHLVIRQHGLRELYHFTTQANLVSILAIGSLLSRRRQAARGIRSERHRWGNLEKEQTIGEDYICLSITKNWAMMSSLMALGAEPLVVLVVEPRVVWYQRTCYSPGNSASREIGPLRLQAWTDVQHFEALFPDSTAHWPTDPQAEVLVRHHIPLEDIKQIVFSSQPAFEATRDGCGLTHDHPMIGKVLVSTRYYPCLER